MGSSVNVTKKSIYLECNSKLYWKGLGISCLVRTLITHLLLGLLKTGCFRLTTINFRVLSKQTDTSPKTFRQVRRDTNL